MNSLAINLEWVLYTDKAVRRKIKDGIWTEGKHYCRAPDGRITMNMQEYYKWVAQK